MDNAPDAGDVSGTDGNKRDSVGHLNTDDACTTGSAPTAGTQPLLKNEVCI